MILSVILQQDVFVFLNKILGLNKNAIVALFVIMKLIMSSVIFWHRLLILLSSTI